MGYDVSYHALPVALIDSFFLPYVLEGAALSDRTRAAVVSRVKVRRRANNWGLGCRQWMGHHDDVATAAGFDSHLHVWGRPLFITETDPFRIPQVIDDWQGCGSDEECDAIARRELERLHPGLAAQVAIAADDNAPDAEDIVAIVFDKPDILRAAVEALARGEMLVGEDGGQRDPAKLLSRHLPYVAVEFCAHFQPGWMDRGPVSPTMVLMAAGYRKAIEHFFESPATLFKSIAGALPGVSFDHLGNTLTSNYALGGLVPYEKVNDLRSFLVKDPDIVPVLREAMTDELGVDDPDLVIRKWNEALVDAYCRDLPFIEASEIYSGIEGRMN